MVDVSQQVTVVIDPRHEHKFVLQHAVTVAIDILHQYRVEQLIDHLHERSIAVEIVGDNRCSNCGRHIPENSQYCPLCEAQDNPSLEESDLPDFNATDEPTLNDDRETFDEGEDRSFLSTVKPIDIQQYLTEFIAAHLIICEEDAELIAIILQASITGRLHSINRDTISTILADEVIDRARELLAFYQNCLPELEVQLPVTVTASGELREAIASIIITRQDDSLSCSIPSRLDDLMLAKSKRNELITFGDIKLPAVLIYRGLLHNRDLLEKIGRGLIEQRRDALLAPSREAMIHQLKTTTLTQKKFAQGIGASEFQISRKVTSRVFINTPHGLFPLNVFFTRGRADSFADPEGADQINKVINDITAEVLREWILKLYDIKRVAVDDIKTIAVNIQKTLAEEGIVVSKTHITNQLTDLHKAATKDDADKKYLKVNVIVDNDRIKLQIEKNPAKSKSVRKILDIIAALVDHYEVTTQQDDIRHADDLLSNRDKLKQTDLCDLTGISRSAFNIILNNYIIELAIAGKPPVTLRELFATRARQDGDQNSGEIACDE